MTSCGYCKTYELSQKLRLLSKVLFVDQAHRDIGEINFVVRDVDEDIKAVAAEPTHPRVLYRHAMELQDF